MSSREPTRDVWDRKPKLKVTHYPKSVSLKPPNGRALYRDDREPFLTAKREETDSPIKSGVAGAVFRFVAAAASLLATLLQWFGTSDVRREELPRFQQEKN